MKQEQRLCTNPNHGLQGHHWCSSNYCCWWICGYRNYSWTSQTAPSSRVSNQFLMVNCISFTLEDAAIHVNWDWLEFWVLEDTQYQHLASACRHTHTHTCGYTSIHTYVWTCTYTWWRRGRAPTAGLSLQVHWAKRAKRQKKFLCWLDSWLWSFSHLGWEFRRP